MIETRIAKIFKNGYDQTVCLPVEAILSRASRLRLKLN